VKYLDLFSGIGGFALGAYWAGWRFEKHYFSEVDPWCCELYQKRFPDAIALGDITKIKTEDLPDGEWIITGGFPCQPFSTAARGRNIGSKDLWPEMLRVIGGLQPVWIIAENVSKRAIMYAAQGLNGMRYRCGVAGIAAASLGAPHRRKRWWLFTNPDAMRKSQFAVDEKMASVPPLARLDRWEDAPDFLGMDDGLPIEMDRLRGLGNAIVPQIAELIFRRIADGERTGL